MRTEPLSSAHAQNTAGAHIHWKLGRVHRVKLRNILSPPLFFFSTIPGCPETTARPDGAVANYKITPRAVCHVHSGRPLTNGLPVVSGSCLYASLSLLARSCLPPHPTFCLVVCTYVSSYILTKTFFFFLFFLRNFRFSEAML